MYLLPKVRNHCMQGDPLRPVLHRSFSKLPPLLNERNGEPPPTRIDASGLMEMKIYVEMLMVEDSGRSFKSVTRERFPI